MGGGWGKEGGAGGGVNFARGVDDWGCSDSQAAATFGRKG